MDEEWKEREEKIKKFEDRKMEEDDDYRASMAKKKAKVALIDEAEWAGGGYEPQ